METAVKIILDSYCYYLDLFGPILNMIGNEADKEDLRDFDPNFYRGRTNFAFPNGDSYIGEYCAHRSGLVWREGFGIYTTKDKQKYKGTWADDRLVEGKYVEITYPNGDQFYGNLVNCKYNGAGMYVIDDLNILCTFVDNKPAGEILLIDGNGREWTGTAQDTTTNSVWLMPDNIFMSSIGKYRGQGRRKKIVKHERRQPIVSATDTSLKPSKRSYDRDLMKEMEMKIFAKSKKTLSNLRFEDSEWYRNYENFKKIHDGITDKLNNKVELTKEENQWLQKYRQFKRRYTGIMANRKTEKLKKLSDYQLFDLYNSEEYKNTCPAISVFYPRTEIASEEANDTPNDV